MTIGHDIAAALERLYYPINLAHEFAHAGVAKAFGGQFELTRRHDGRLGIDVEFDESASMLALIATALAPTWLGLPLLLLLLDDLAAALTGASGLLEALTAVLSFVIVLRFAWPSIEDIAVPIGLASDQLGGAITVKPHVVALLSATIVVASVTLFSAQQGTVWTWAWYHLVGLAGVIWVGLTIFREWRAVDIPAIEDH